MMVASGSKQMKGRSVPSRVEGSQIVATVYFGPIRTSGKLVYSGYRRKVSEIAEVCEREDRGLSRF